MKEDGLSQAEMDLFKDPAIEAAFQAWASELIKSGKMAVSLRKQFLLRIRALVQSGKIK